MRTNRMNDVYLIRSKKLIKPGKKTWLLISEKIAEFNSTKKNFSPIIDRGGLRFFTQFNYNLNTF